ncbi:MAG: ABC-2 transporter permease [Oscillospiraceae bacterium]|nr:ABC-2 transporter permease [Oscillospiraceae bacterium]
MKDILKIMRFDFLTAKPLALRAFIIVAALFSLLSLFFAPLICSYITFGAMVFVIPLQAAAEKSGFHKLYGTLPVRRKNIVRARFLYIFLVHFAVEMLELVLAAAAMSLKLYRVLPNRNGEMMQMVKDSFGDTKLTLLMVIGMFTVSCLIFSYMEMMGQICGRENEFKIIMITLSILTALLVGFLILSDRGIIPTIQMPSLPDTVQGVLLLGAALNIVMFGICLIFGEITASRLAKREL